MWRVTIDGVDQTDAVDSFSTSVSLNDRARASVVVGDLMPARFAEVISYAADGITPLFGGVILQRSFQGRTPYDPTYQLTLELGDWMTFADWCYSTKVYPVAVTLKQVLADLVTEHLAQYGITLDPGQAEGPTIAAFTWTNKRVADALRELSDRTTWVVRIDPAKQLRMFIPGTTTAPVALTEAAPHCHDVTWRDSDRTPYNKIVLSCGPGGPSEVADERHYGDGVTRIFPLFAPFLQVIGALSRSDEEGGYPLGTYGVDDFPYTYDAAINAVRQRADQPVVPAGQYIWLWYLAQFPFTVTRATGATPIVEHAEARPDVMSIPVGEEIAETLLTQAQEAPREAVITTDQDGFVPGQALTIDLPVTRAIAGAYMITSVALNILQDTVAGDRLWQYTMEAIESPIYQGSYLDGWREIAGVGGGTTVINSTPPSAGGPAGPASPIFLGGSRQFSLEPSPAAWLPVVDYMPYVAGSDFTGRVRADLNARHAGVGVQTRLYNVTDAVETAISEVVTSTTPVSVMFSAAIVASKVYRLEVRATVNGEGVFAIGSLEVA